jgi:hypothetical protein
MDKFHCRICKKDFSNASGLTRHANAMHHGKTSLSQGSRSQQQIQSPEHDSDLWNMPITRPSESDSPIFAETPMLQVDIENVIDETLESDPDPQRSQEEELRINLEDHDSDSEDLQGASFDDALDSIEGKNRPEHVAKWPNEAYREFMELIVDGNISNKIGDKIIKLFNKHSNLENSPLPSSTKSGKDYLNQINSPLLDFKEKVIATYNEVDFTLYYRLIFRAIQTLLQRSEVADGFVHKGILKKDDSGRIFEEQFECDWWLETEKTLPPLNHLLSIILYSDVTTFDGLGKTSGHPVFLTLGNIPNCLRNLPEAKVLLGFLPKVQDSGIKTTKNFRILQREVFHKCFSIIGKFFRPQICAGLRFYNFCAVFLMKICGDL